MKQNSRIASDMLKRLFDIVASGLGLVILSPVFLAVALWIKYDSKGPVFYRQARVGRYNRDFRIFKFRSMYMGSDKGSLITIGGDDPRVTRSGYYIRKFKIDELPQLINVFIGDMSLVGPRPQVRKYVRLYTPSQMRVLSVRPGITDPASIAYRHESEILAEAPDADRLYEQVIIPHKLQLAMNYIDRRNFWTDLGIILRTFVTIPNRHVPASMPMRYTPADHHRREAAGDEGRTSIADSREREKNRHRVAQADKNQRRREKITRRERRSGAPRGESVAPTAQNRV